METAKFIVAMAGLLILSARAETTEYSGAEAAKHIGETATVTGQS
jgi:hypothetical protein